MASVLPTNVVGLLAGSVPHRPKPLTNAERHAAPERVTITVRFRRDDVEITVADDGRGFDPAAVAQKATGLGLLGMRERAKLAGGTLRITSNAATGITVRVGVRT